MSWNIARGRRLDEIAEFLAGANADLILLQEVDKHARRTAYRNIAEFLAQKLRLFYAFGIEFHELAQGSRDAPAHHGQATLSRWPLCDSRVLRFSETVDLLVPETMDTVTPAVSEKARRPYGAAKLMP